MAKRERRITEQVNPRTTGLDQLEPRAILERILDEDARVAAAVAQTLDRMAEACDVLTDTLRRGGRWINVGAGTSGRLGVLDAAEIPPTFGLPPDRVQGVLAGGQRALTRAVEGAEDDGEAGAQALRARRLAPGDAVVAISASGCTPYALGAVAYARELGAATIAISCAPDSALVRAVDVAIVPVVGPEAITGSTRLKGGLAQKMVLHALSSAVMVRLGRVRGNLMTSLRPVSRKLQERSVRIVADLCECTPEQAREALAAVDGSIEAAIDRLSR